jgi:hypothetical protein
MLRRLCVEPDGLAAHDDRFDVYQLLAPELAAAYAAAIGEENETAPDRDASAVDTHRNAQILTVLRDLDCHNDERHRALLIDSIRVMPSLLLPYLQRPPFTLEPRESTNWFGAMRLVQRLLELPPPAVVSRAGQGPPASFVSLVANVVPPTLTPVVFSAAFKANTPTAVRTAALRLLSVVLQRVASVHLNFANVRNEVDGGVGGGQASQRSQAWARFGERCNAAIQKLLPPFETINEITQAIVTVMQRDNADKALLGDAYAAAIRVVNQYLDMYPSSVIADGGF